MNKLLITTFVLLLVMFQSLFAQVDNVTFVNTGAMNVAPNGVSGVSLFVPDAMRQQTVAGRSVNIIHNGITELGGNFYQDAATTVFDVNATTTVGTSTGKFRFVTDRGVNRTVTTQSNAINEFDRGLHYVAFPNFEISTNDSVIIQGKMGIDAISLHRVNAKTGQMVLRSDVVTDVKGTNAYDASLRITGAGLSADLVDLGAVVVERDMSIYRPDGSTSNLFGFATPFKNTQLSGYYAGNWVRRPLSNGDFGHTTYIYGNKDASPADNIIDKDQYVYLAAEKLVPAQAYLIKPRPKGFNYQTLRDENGLWYTADDPSLYDKSKFHFNGKVYAVAPYLEQLFADDVMYTNTISTPNLTFTANLLIGNSYTCPIPTNLLAQKMESYPNLKFYPYIYVYPAGASTYQPLAISGTGNGIVVADVTEIPAMSVFMVRLSKENAQSGTFEITKDLQRHADVAHNNPQTIKASDGRMLVGASATSTAASTPVVKNQVTFKVTPTTNEHLYDMAAIGLREDATLGTDNYDIAKAYINDRNLFQLYTRSSSGSKLSANGVPLATDTVMLDFEPNFEGGEYKLTANYAESLETEGVWILDNKIGKWVDIKTEKSYTFNASPNDKAERFYVLFKKPFMRETDTTNSLLVYYNNNNVLVRQLTKEDVGSTITLYDPQGRQLYAKQVDNYPDMTIPVNNLLPGVYMVQLKGEHTGIAKFIKK